MQFGIHKHLLIFQRTQIALALQAHAILLVFKKIYSWLFTQNCTRNHVITYTNRKINCHGLSFVAMELVLGTHLIENIRDILIARRFPDVAETWFVYSRYQAVVTN